MGDGARRPRVGQGGELSGKTEMDFDCKNETSRVRSLSTYTEQMRGGEVLYSGRGTDKPRPVEPDSVEGGDVQVRLLPKAALSACNAGGMPPAARMPKPRQSGLFRVRSFEGLRLSLKELGDRR